MVDPWLRKAVTAPLAKARRRSTLFVGTSHISTLRSVENVPDVQAAKGLCHAPKILLPPIPALTRLRHASKVGKVLRRQSEFNRF